MLLHGFERHFAHPAQQPYRAFFTALRSARNEAMLSEAAREAGSDERAIDLYRSGQSCHPLLPFADWDACQPAIARAGRIIAAGCRDAAVARQLGFIPSHGIGRALELALGHPGQEARIGFLLGPPYAALQPASTPESPP